VGRGTNGINHQEIIDSLEEIEITLQQNQLRMVFISGDGAGANAQVFKYYLTGRPHLPRVVPFGDYSHLLKNIRNNIIDQSGEHMYRVQNGVKRNGCFVQVII
jgi:hypothetical protein